MASQPPPGHRLKIRQRFSGFYDLRVKQDGGATDIDGANFDAEAYVTGLLKHKQLSDLIVRSNELSGEIKELDSDMQMLVYENYNKFIVATDTIQLMKEKVDSMSHEMASLSASVHDITATSTNINNNLADRRVRIQKLNGVRRLLKKLSFIFELPTRLSRAVELDACAEAVKYWSTSLPVLRAYAHVPAFVAVDQESSIILTKLRLKLIERFSSPETAPDDLHEAASLLLQLSEPSNEVRDQYLAVRRARLEHLVASHSTSGDLSDKNGPLSLRVLNESKDLVISYHELFLSPPLSGTAASRSTQGAAGAAAAAAAGGAMSPGGQSGAAVDARSVELILDLIKSVTGAHIDNLRHALSVANSQLAGKGDTRPLVERLEQWHDAVRSVDAILPTAEVSVKSDEVVCGCGERRIAADFDALEEMVGRELARLCRAASEPSGVDATEVERCVKNVSQAWARTLEGLRGLITSETHLMTRFRGTFVARLHEGMVGVLKGLPSHFVSNRTDVTRLTPRGLCTQTAFFLALKRTGLESIFAAVPVASGDAAGGKMLQETASRMTRQVEACSRDLAKRYAQARVRGACAQLSARMGVGGARSAPARTGGGLVEVLCEDVRDAVEDLKMLGEGEAEEEVEGGGGQSAGGGGSMVDLDRASLGREVIVSALVLLHLRTLMEAVRVQTLSTEAYHRVVVQVHSLRAGLKGTVKDERGVHLLLDEIVATAAERCTDPKPLSSQQIHELCSTPNS